MRTKRQTIAIVFFCGWIPELNTHTHTQNCLQLYNVKVCHIKFKYSKMSLNIFKAF